MPARAVPRDMWTGYQAGQASAETGGLLDSLRQKYEEATAPIQQAAQSAYDALPAMPSLPSLDDLTSTITGLATPTPAAPASSGTRVPLPGGSSFGLPSLDDLTRMLGGTTDAETATQSATPSFSGAPVGLPQISAGAGTVPAPGGPIDNSSRESFVRTAYPYALRAADGDPQLANQLLATAISENGNVGTGKDLGADMGFNFGGIQGVEGTAGSFTALDAGRPRQFAAYRDPSEGFRAVRDLVSGGRYAQAAANYRQTGDIDRYWREVNEAGYSETPDWQDRIGSIRRNQVETVTRGLTPAPTGPQPTTPPAAEQTLAAQAQTNSALDVQGITQAYKGVPYVFGGAGGRSDFTPGAASDCSGFVSSVFKNQYGVDLVAHTDGAYNQLRQLGAPEVGAKDARPGDVVFYMGAGTGGAITHHMGIYAGPGKVLDMSVSGGDGVRVRDIGHAGQFVILRDPRINQEPARTASVPPPIVPTGIAERTGGEKLDRDEMARLSLNAASGGSAMQAEGEPLGPKPRPQRNIEPLGPALAGATWEPRYTDEEGATMGTNRNMPRLGDPIHEGPDVPPPPPPWRNQAVPGGYIYDGPRYWDETGSYEVPMSQKLSPNTAPGAPSPDAQTGGGSPSPAAAGTTPYPPSPWEQATGGGPVMMKQDAGGPPVRDSWATDPRQAPPDATGQNPTNPDILPGDGGYAPDKNEQNLTQPDTRQYDDGPHEAIPGSVGAQPLPQTDQNYPMSYGPVEQAPAPLGPEQPEPTIESRAADAAQAAFNGPMVSAAVKAAQEAYNDPVWQAFPAPARAVYLVSQAASAFGDAAAREVAKSLGVSDEELFSILGHPVSGQDLAGFAGSIAADPTNYVGLGAADPLMTVARGAFRDVAPEIVQRAGRAAGGIVREGADALGRGLQGVGREIAGGLMDLNPVLTPRMADAGPGVGRALAEGAGDAGRVVPPMKAQVETDRAVENLRANGVEVVDIPVGHMITPDGRGVKAWTPHGIANHWEVAVDAGYLPREALTGDLPASPMAIVNGLLEKGWIRSKGQNMFEVWGLTPKKTEIMEDILIPSAKYGGMAYLDDAQSGISYAFDLNDFKANDFRLGPTLARAEKQSFSAAAPARLSFIEPPPPHVYSPEPAPGVQRRYHGTAGAFDAADPAKFDENGLYGPGYYTTSDPRVASSYADQRGMAASAETLRDSLAYGRRYIEELRTKLPQMDPDGRLARSTQQEISRLETAIPEWERQLVQAEANPSGPYVRAIDIPPTARLLDVEAPLDPALLDRVDAVIDTMARQSPDVAARLREATQIVRDRLANGGVARTNDAVVQELFNAAERVPGMGKGLATEVLQQAGYDGIAHSGGKRVPMFDAAGAPIEHDVTVIFPDSVGKVKNAFSGTYGGATPGVSPGLRGSGIGTQLATDVGNSAGGGVFGAATGYALPADTEEERRQNALRGAGIGMVAGPVAGRLMRGAGGALATPGVGPGYDPRLSREPVLPGLEPPRGRIDLPNVSDAPNRAPALGDVPPSAIGRPSLPGMDPLRDVQAPGPVEPFAESRVPNIAGVQRAVASAQQRQAALAARGGEPLSPLQWTRALAANIGYSSMIGPATATVNIFGNLLEPVWAIPKETARAVSRGNVREATTMAAGAFRGMAETGTAMVDAIMARGRYASNPDHPTLSARTTQPILKAIATATEVGGRVFSGMPDAIFGTVARSAGEARQAAQIATDEGLKGASWSQRVKTLLGEVEQSRKGELPIFPTEVDDIIKAGEKYADDQTFRTRLGTVGRGASSLAGRDIPVVGNLITPFFNTPWNMGVTLAERTPIGAVMNRQKGFDKAYDALVGSALVTGLVVGPAASGNITGSGPNDLEKRKMLEAEGWKPYHTLIDGVYVPNRVFGIYGKLLNAVGEAHDAMAYQRKDGNVGSEALRRFGLLLKEEPYLQGLSDIMQAINAPNGSGLSSYGASTLTRMVPYASTARAIGTAMDPTERVVDSGKTVPWQENVSQRVQQGVGLRVGLPVAQDVLGRPKENPQQGLRAILPALRNAKSEPLVRAYLDAGVDISAPPTSVEGVTLTPAQQRRYQEVMGRELGRVAGPTVSSPTWQNTPPATQKMLLETFQDIAKTLAEVAVQSEGGADYWRQYTEATLQKATAP